MRLTRFERFDQPLASRCQFFLRLAGRVVLAIFVIAMAVGVAAVIYYLILRPDDGFWMAMHRASRIISGLGPDNDLRPGWETFFVDAVALFSTLVLTAVISVIVVPPVFHRVLHHLQRPDDEDEPRAKPNRGHLEG